MTLSDLEGPDAKGKSFLGDLLNYAPTVTQVDEECVSMGSDTPPS